MIDQSRPLRGRTATTGRGSVTLIACLFIRLRITSRSGRTARDCTVILAERWIEKRISLAIRLSAPNPTGSAWSDQR